jgi:hypothetical protein
LPDVQITFYQRLQDVRRTLLLDALLNAVARADIQEIDRQFAQFVTNEMLQKVASWGLRGEILFPVPYLLTQHPQLLGYYRLLLGFSQKQFYGKEYGFGVFKSLEEKGRITTRHTALLAEFCQCLCKMQSFLCMGLSICPTIVCTN